MSVFIFEILFEGYNSSLIIFIALKSNMRGGNGQKVNSVSAA